ncbi:IucA/IucC family siderophore biosynthesis protein [Bacillus sp. SB49]|uniref:IucA/IucC family protein n=1 Tax=Bacillus sp. SB49 TaxID=1071080 RepID=UPI00042A86FD|nr:IucA/IucC family protein [Bacillus sp. SB49]QHT46172.1 IucA/IucC family siderophore biosynthesis protein [Bacillus sp. SB49]
MHNETNRTTYIQNQADRIILHLLMQAMIREKAYPYDLLPNGAAFPIGKAALEVEITHTYRLGQLDIARVQYVEGEDVQEITDPLQVLGLFLPTDDPFYIEVKNSVRNLALALTASEERNQEVEQEAEALGVSDVFSYVLQKKSKMFSPLTFFEQLVIQGHTIHPCARTRIGLSEKEARLYAPEWGGTPAVIPVAVHKQLFRETLMEGKTVKEILFAEYPEVEKAFLSEINHPDDYALIPVHPWQWKHTIVKDYQADIEAGRIKRVKGADIATAALISFRSLAPLNNQWKHHIKTAVNIQMTSAVRTVSAASTYNGPMLSRFFKDLLESDEALRSHLSTMKEPAAIHYQPSTGVEDVHFFQKNLAAIVRENPEHALGDEEVAIPGASLLAPSPVSGKTIAEEASERAGSPRSFIRRYAEALLPGVLHLLGEYGIAMEAHLQNAVVVFKGGHPLRTILRDHGGIRVLEKRLAEHFGDVPIDASTNLLTDDTEELLDIFTHSVLHNHLGEIIVQLARKTGCAEDGLWAEVEKVIKETAVRLSEEAREDIQRILHRPARMKALVQMRLKNEVTENRYVDMPNPFTKESEVRGR